MKNKGGEPRTVKSIGCELLCEVAKKGPDGTTYGHSYKSIIRKIKKERPDVNTRVGSLYNYVIGIKSGLQGFKGYKLPDSRLDSQSKIPVDSVGKSDSPAAAAAETSTVSKSTKNSSATKTTKSSTKKAATKRKTTRRKVTAKKTATTGAAKRAARKRASAAKSTKRTVAAKQVTASKTAAKKAPAKSAKASIARKRRKTGNRLLRAPIAKSPISQKPVKATKAAKRKVTRKSVKTRSVAKRNAAAKTIKSAKVGNRMAAPRLVGSGKSLDWKSTTKIAFIRASWHFDIVDGCRKSFAANLKTYGIKGDQIDVFDVPGSFEIPLLAKQLAKKGRYDVIVGCGLVIDGGIYRHEFVAEAVINGMMQVQLDSEVPILSAVLTPHNFHESNDQQKFFKSHFKKKGLEVANAAKLVLNNKLRLDGKL